MTSSKNRLQTLIAYSSNSRAYLKWLEAGKPENHPSDIPFFLPYGARKGDRYLIFVGGVDQSYVGWGVISSQRNSGKGNWEKTSIWLVQEHYFRNPVPGDDILAATGFKSPRVEKVLDDSIAGAVWRAARGLKLTSTDRAVEGILTETRSRSRNAGLRTAAIKRAGGVCQGCGVNFLKRHGGLGKHCLVVHHKKQLKDTDQPSETKLTDLAVVCANCHMMIHANREKALTLPQLKKKIGKF
jgi:5-methylcytosine-specific restriction endonuclease McrA